MGEKVEKRKKGGIKRRENDLTSFSVFNLTDENFAGKNNN